MGAPDDGGSPSSDTIWSREPEGACQARIKKTRNGRIGRPSPIFRRPQGRRIDGLTVEEEAVIIAFAGIRFCLRRLPLRASADDCSSDPLVVASLPAAPWPRLPEVEGEASPKRKFKAYPIGYFHIDIAEVRTAEGRLSSSSRSTGPRSLLSSNSARRSRGATLRLPASTDRGRPLQGPHGPYRQRNPLHRSRWLLLVPGGWAVDAKWPPLGAGRRALSLRAPAMPGRIRQCIAAPPIGKVLEIRRSGAVLTGAYKCASTASTLTITDCPLPGAVPGDCVPKPRSRHSQIEVARGGTRCEMDLEAERFFEPLRAAKTAEYRGLGEGRSPAWRGSAASDHLIT